MSNYIHLRKFKTEELIFDEKETIIILKFIFSNRKTLVEGMTINDRVREFAQGLLIEAVDASYALGFVEALFRATANPGAGTKKILTKFGKKALKNWFKHATPKDLMQVKIYEIVRKQLEYNFGRVLILHSNGTAMNEINNAAFITYSLNQLNSEKDRRVWG